MGRRLRCSAIESPIKVMQQPTVVDSPQKAAPLRASAALLFVDSLLPCETSDPIQVFFTVASTLIFFFSIYFIQ